MRKAFIIFKREFRNIVFNKAFLITTLSLPVFLFAITILPTMLATSGKISGVKIAVVSTGSPLPEGFEASILPGLSSGGIELSQIGPDLNQLNDAVLSGNLYGYLKIPSEMDSVASLEFVTKAGTDYRILNTIESAVGSAITAKRLAKAGLNPDKVKAMMKTPTVQPVKLSAQGKTEKQDFLSSLFTGLGVAMLLYFTILIYGVAIGRSVVQEKTSKTVEILLSSVKPADLLFGKILGQGAAGLFQYGIWLSIGMLLVKLFNKQGNPALEALFGSPMLLVLLGYFILGYLLYASLYSAVGSLAEDEQNLNQMGWPILIFLILPMVLVSNFIQQPNSPLTVFLSQFPMTSPIVMSLRLGITTVSWWEILLSFTLLILAIIGAVAASAKIFKTAILMSGKKFKWSEILSWLKA